MRPHVPLQVFREIRRRREFVKKMNRLEWSKMSRWQRRLNWDMAPAVQSRRSITEHMRFFIMERYEEFKLLLSLDRTMMFQVRCCWMPACVAMAHCRPVSPLRATGSSGPALVAWLRQQCTVANGAPVPRVGVVPRTHVHRRLALCLRVYCVRFGPLKDLGKRQAVLRNYNFKQLYKSPHVDGYAQLQREELQARKKRLDSRRREEEAGTIGAIRNAGVSGFKKYLFKLDNLVNDNKAPGAQRTADDGGTGNDGDEGAHFAQKFWGCCSVSFTPLCVGRPWSRCQAGGATCASPAGRQGLV